MGDLACTLQNHLNPAPLCSEGSDGNKNVITFLTAGQIWGFLLDHTVSRLFEKQWISDILAYSNTFLSLVFFT